MFPFHGYQFSLSTLAQVFSRTVQQATEKMDRVSNLPDEILCHVLSFLPTKHAASTSLLSKRWHNLWKIDPVYDIDDSVFLHPEEGKGERDDIRQGFVDFVEAVLAMQGDSPIQKFSLKCITGVRPDIVNRWICNVLRRGVSDLDLFLDFSYEYVVDEEYNLPQEMFVSRTLVKLKLRSEHSVYWWHQDMGSSLPMLKSLYIDSDLIFTNMIEEFVPSFPVLEELRMANMEWSNLEVTVSSGSLKKLTLHGTGCEDFKNPKRISFDTPNLLFLSYSDLVAEDYPLVNMKSLLGAFINLMVTDEDQVKRIRTPSNDDGDAVLQFGNVVKLMNGLQNVQKLSLLADTLEVLSLCCESMPVFNHLKFLGVTSNKNRGWQAMPVLLRNCPRLETIIMEGLLHHVTDRCGDACDCISREEKGRSLTSCPVNRLEIQGFKATIKEMNMIKHFLDYFPSLKRLDVFVEENDPTPLRNPEVSKHINEMFDLYNELSNCKVDLLIGG